VAELDSPLVLAPALFVLVLVLVLVPVPETRNPKPETRNPKPETRNPKPETRNPKPETRNPKPENMFRSPRQSRKTFWSGPVELVAGSCEIEHEHRCAEHEHEVNNRRLVYRFFGPLIPDPSPPRGRRGKLLRGGA
jgi:hypothetical protein